MSLRARVLSLIGLVLVAGMLVGALFAGYEARRALQAELSAAMVGGEQTVRSAFEDLPRSDHSARDLRQLIATFDGNRHVRASLIGADGRSLVASRSAAPTRRAPWWFSRLLGPAPSATVISAPAGSHGFRAVRLEPTSGLDVGVLWAEFTGVLAALAGSVVAGLVLVYAAIGAALRPLSALSDGFERIGAGDYGGQVRIQAPSELVRLADGFNAMAGRLAAMDDHNRALESQLLTLQEEERADLARDLHDEIGPHLFAVNVDAQVIAELVTSGRAQEVAERVNAIQAGVGHMQRLVREILGRLRPTRATELGLNAAIGDLVAFWQARRPEVTFEATLLEDEARLGETQKDTVYRVIQEGVSNALRHASPTRVHIAVRSAGRGRVVVEVRDDGVAGASADMPGSAPSGLGLIGMRERVRASGGVLEIDRGEGREGGWRLSATLPMGSPEPEPKPASGPELQDVQP